MCLFACDCWLYPNYMFDHQLPTWCLAIIFFQVTKGYGKISFHTSLCIIQGSVVNKTKKYTNGCQLTSGLKRKYCWSYIITKNIFTYKLLYFRNHFTQVVVVRERLAWVCDLVSPLKPQLTQRTVVSPISVPSRNLTISLR